MSKQDTLISNKHNQLKTLICYHESLKEKVWRSRSLIELLEYKGLSLCWFIRKEFFFFFARKLWNRTVKQQINLVNLLYLGFKILSSPPIHVIPLTAYTLLRFILRGLLLKPLVRNPHQIGKKILIVSHRSNWREVWDPSTGSKHKDEFFLYNVLKELHKHDLKNIFAVEAEGFIPKIKVTVERMTRSKSNIRPWEYYFSLKALKHAVVNYVKIIRNVDLAIKNSSNKNSLILSAFKEGRHGLLPHIFFAILYMEIAELIFDREHPDIVIFEWEYDPLSEAVMASAKKKGIPTIAIQHGIIEEAETQFYHPPDELIPYGARKILRCLIPDKTLVFGEVYRNILVNCDNYPEKSVIVTGDPKLILPKWNQEQKEKALRDMGFDPKRKAILFTAQIPVRYLPSNLPLKSFEMVTNALSLIIKDHPYILIVKLHPDDKEASKKYYYSIAKNKEIKNVFVTRDRNIYELISLSDILITVYSTTALEALLFGKPTIILGIGGWHSDSIRSLCQDAVIEVKNAKDLSRVLINVPGQRMKCINVISKLYYEFNKNAPRNVFNEIVKTLNINTLKRIDYHETLYC